MHRFFARLAPVTGVPGAAAALAVLLLVMSSCGGGDTPTEPAPPAEIVETFPTEGLGTLTLNGAFSHPFTVTVPGSMVAQLIVLRPVDEALPQESAGPVGLALGTWNGSICQIVLADDVTRQGDVVPGNSTAAGEFCVRIYDASGTLPGPQNYQIVVSHF
jgi:hypothetical protein